jgi:hypothetical protein
MNKHKQIDTTQPVTFELSTPELPNFTIEGSYEDVLPIHTELAQALPTRMRRSRGQEAATDAPTFVTRATTAFVGRLAVDAKAAVYDLRNGTHFLQAVREKRQLEKDLRMAQSLGLLTVDVCAKHRKALEAVKSVR